MHTAALVVALFLAGGSSSSVRPGVPQGGHVLLASSHAAAAGSRVLSSTNVTFNGAVTQMEWTQSVSGVDGVGDGNDVFEISVLVSGAPVCVLSVACDAPAPADYVVACDSAEFTIGQDVDVRITSMPCLGAPSGFHTTDLSIR